MPGSCTHRRFAPYGRSLHFERRSPLGLAYLTLERALERCTELFLFESAYARDVFFAKVGDIRGTVRMIGVHRRVPRKHHRQGLMAASRPYLLRRPRLEPADVPVHGCAHPSA